MADSALFAMPTLGGYSVVLPNDGTGETDINLEILFELALARPEMLKSIFKEGRN